MAQTDDVRRDVSKDFNGTGQEEEGEDTAVCSLKFSNIFDVICIKFRTNLTEEW